jgi:hypothetical protein
MIAPSLHPSHQQRFPANVLSPQAATVYRSLPFANLVERNRSFLNVNKIFTNLGFLQIQWCYLRTLKFPNRGLLFD